QTEIPWRVEEMRTEPVPPEVIAAPLRERRDRNTRRVRADDRAGTSRGVDLFEQRPFDVELLDNRLDNPVAVLDARELAEAAGRNQLPGIRREEGVRLQRSRPLETIARGVAAD